MTKETEKQSAISQRTVVTLSVHEILDRVKGGDRLRFVPGNMIGISDSRERYLILGSDHLDDESALRVMELSIRRQLVASEDDDTEICDYLLP